MTIASEIQRIQTNIANAYDAAEAKGATMPATENSDNLATTISSISGGGGGAYKVGDRISDDSNNPVGIVSSIFTDGSNNNYAVVCLDAQYRLASGLYYQSQSSITDLPKYSLQAQAPYASESATFNTTKILAMAGTSTACSHCRSKSFVINGVTYYGQLPNLNEVGYIVAKRSTINNQDPSASDYSSLTIQDNTSIWSSTQKDTSRAYDLSSNIDYNNYNNKNSSLFVCPVLEIPLD